MARLSSIHDFIKRDSPFYATQTIDKLTRRVEQLIDHPHSGCIDIIAVFYGAQQLPDSL